MKRFTLSLFFIILIAALVGCSPKGDPKEGLNKYYTNIMKDSQLLDTDDLPDDVILLRK